MKWQAFKKEGGAIPAPQPTDQIPAVVTLPATTDDARRLFQEIKTRDPGGDCWSWLQRNRPDLWRSHIKALQAGDITAARLSFNEMLTVWQSRHQMQQADLLAA